MRWLKSQIWVKIKKRTKKFSERRKSTWRGETFWLKFFVKMYLKIVYFRYKRDYYINDSSDGNKRHSYGSSTSKSPIMEDEVSDDYFNRKLHNQHHERDFLVEKLLNSNFDTVSMTSRDSLDSSERNFSIPKDILRQLESQMLHADLKRESFRARSGTRNFCLNPLYEEGFKLDDSENNLSTTELSVHAQRVETLPSTTSSVNSIDEMKSNCVENIFLGLDKVRRSGSVKSVESDRPRFAAERCNSLKRRERNLK